MSIRPLDLQTNMSQISEVGKGEQAKTGALAEQQHLLDEESDEKSKLVNSKLDEAKKGEGTAIKEEKKNERKKKGAKDRSRDDEDKNEEKEKRQLSHDDRMGRFIDVLK
ncbi:MAG: hypothetical protein GY754_20025 [bacterium]|nr:hypothetical protein [bacterium]